MVLQGTLVLGCVSWVTSLSKPSLEGGVLYRSGPSFFDGLIVLILGVANAQTIVAEGFLVKQDVFFFLLGRKTDTK